MKLELWQSGKLIGSVTLFYFQVGDDLMRKQGYSATVVPGLDHTYKLSMDGGGNVPSDWIIGNLSCFLFGLKHKLIL